MPTLNEFTFAPIVPRRNPVLSEAVYIRPIPARQSGGADQKGLHLHGKFISNIGATFTFVTTGALCLTGARLFEISSERTPTSTDRAIDFRSSSAQD